MTRLGNVYKSASLHSLSLWSGSRDVGMNFGPSEGGVALAGEAGVLSKRLGDPGSKVGLQD